MTPSLRQCQENGPTHGSLCANPVFLNVFVTPAPVQQFEGNAGLTPVTMTVMLSAAQAQDVIFDIRPFDGFATVADNDYLPITNQRVTVPATQTQATFTVNFVGDLTPDSNEPFRVELFHTVGSMGLAALADVTILDDDGPPHLPAAAPTLQPWALVGLAALLGTVVVLRLRRRA